MYGAIVANICADAALLAPGGEADAAAGPADPRQLVRDALVIGGEDHADRRRDDVEGGVGVVEVLAVGHLERQVEAELGGTALRRLDEGRREIGGGHDRPGAGGVERDIAGPAGEIEPLLPGLGARRSTSARCMSLIRSAMFSNGAEPHITA